MYNTKDVDGVSRMYDDIKGKDIEIDVDGVLADMDGSYTEYVKHLLPDFTEEKYVRNWGLPELKEAYPEVHKIITSLWVNADFYSDLPYFPKVVEGMQKLYEVSKGKANIVVHTHILNDELVYKSRENWLKRLQRDSGVPFKIEISFGDVKDTRDKSFIVIEDNVFNLQKSKADYKMLIRRWHNRDFDAKDVGECKGAFVFQSFYDSVFEVEKILGG